ncbi:hypothetical protein BC834DRAFT_27703 [Gloeopeniophorella convolvens]|nr:hypothetical protein BC834DRAFT_27703 [Gloeopeniophorella convolvens]
MGRSLRFEPARCQRTLWISYKIPVDATGDAEHEPTASPMNPLGRAPAVALPTSVTICRFPNAKRGDIFYDCQDPPPSDRADFSSEQGNTTDTLSPEALVLSPLTFDSQTLLQTVSFFGTVESFELCKPESTDPSQERAGYPSPHDALRAPGMDTGCWEVKWENRSDCLSALATLRESIYLNVTWPNQQHVFVSKRNGTYYRGHQAREQSMPVRRPGQQQFRMRRGEASNVTSHAGPPASPLTSWDVEINTTAATAGSRPSSERRSIPSELDPHSVTDDWTVVEAGSTLDLQNTPAAPEITTSNQSPQARAPDGVASPELEGSPAVEPTFDSSDRLEWSEIVSENQAYPQDHVMTASPTPPFRAASEGGDPQFPPAVSVTALNPPAIDNLASPFVPKSPEPTYPRISSGFGFYDNFSAPSASQWPELRPRRSVVPCDENMDVNRDGLDPTTIFVGGLEVHGRCTWDEQRLRRVFGQYGEIDEIKLVRPAQKKSAFAFVKFNNSRSSSQAVLAEHNRIYDGRHIRVQIRDSTVQRFPGWKTNGKPKQGRPFSPRHQLSFKAMDPPVEHHLRSHNGIPPTIPGPGEGTMVIPPCSPNGSTPARLDTAGHSSENACMPSIPSHASSLTVANVSSMVYPPLPPPGFYAPAPWFMHPYPYGPPQFVPSYPQMPLAPAVVNMGDPGRAAAPGSMYQPIPHYSMYSLPLPPPPPRQQSEMNDTSERRAPLQPTGFIESEQGLIPVYAPEALNEYIARNGPHQNSPEAGPRPPGNPKAVVDHKLPQPIGAYATYHPPYQTPLAPDNGISIAGQPIIVPRPGPTGAAPGWHTDSMYSEHRAPAYPHIAHAPPIMQTADAHMGMFTMGQGQPPRRQSLQLEHGFNPSKHRPHGDRPTFVRTNRSYYASEHSQRVGRTTPGT